MILRLIFRDFLPSSSHWDDTFFHHGFPIHSPFYSKHHPGIERDFHIGKHDGKKCHPRSLSIMDIKIIFPWCFLLGISTLGPASFRTDQWLHLAKKNQAPQVRPNPVTRPCFRPRFNISRRPLPFKVTIHRLGKNMMIGWKLWVSNKICIPRP